LEATKNVEKLVPTSLIINYTTCTIFLDYILHYFKQNRNIIKTKPNCLLNLDKKSLRDRYYAQVNACNAEEKASTYIYITLCRGLNSRRTLQNYWIKTSVCVFLLKIKFIPGCKFSLRAQILIQIRERSMWP